MIEVRFEDGGRYEFYLVGENANTAEVYRNEYNDVGKLIEVTPLSLLRLAKHMSNATGSLLNSKAVRTLLNNRNTKTLITDNGMFIVRQEGPRKQERW